MKKSFLLLFIIFFTGISLDAQTKDLRYQPKEYVEITHPEWSKNATIYEVNVRQYTPEGTFKAFENHLPRLKNMGVDIIWLMPIHPIGVQNRKGTLGSYYSVKDFYGINPEFGTMKDFQHLLIRSTRWECMLSSIGWEIIPPGIILCDAASGLVYENPRRKFSTNTLV